MGNRDKPGENWSVDIGLVREGDFLHICSEPDDILRITSNMPSFQVLSVLRRAALDLDVLVRMRNLP